jgi:hypothetical protein
MWARCLSDGSLADEQHRGKLAVGMTLDDEVENLPLSH